MSVERLLADVSPADEAWRTGWPGPPAWRQPVQVLYAPADRVTSRTAREAGDQARDLLDRFAPDPAALAAAVGIAPPLADEVRARVASKLELEPVEDLRVDFEDGYLGHTEDDEARAAVATAREMARAHREGIAPPFFGLRVKSFTDGLSRRSVATLDRFVTVLVDELGTLPEGFVITFPKIVSVAHVAAFAQVLGELERVTGLPEGRLRFEAQIETTASVLGPDGRVVLRDIRDAAAGRLCAAHLGVYDYTAALGLPPTQQRLEHPACDAVRHLMQITFAGTEVRLSDGSVNAVPASDTREEVHRIWSRHAAGVRHSLAHGFEQGWDLHPSHLVSRYAVVYADVLDGLDGALERLERWHAGRGGAGVLDEPATIRRLEAQVQRAVDTAAVDPAEVGQRIGRAVQRRPATLWGGGSRGATAQL